MKEPWQENKVVIIAIYTEEFIAFLKSKKQKPGLINARVDGKKYNIAPGKPCRVPVRVADQLSKQPYIASVVEVK